MGGNTRKAVERIVCMGTRYADTSGDVIDGDWVFWLMLYLNFIPWIKGIVHP